MSAPGREALAALGAPMTLISDQRPGGAEFLGYLQPMAYGDVEALHTAAQPGGVKKAIFLLVADPEAPFEGQTRTAVVSRGFVYELLRADPFYVGDARSHWEALVRLKGRVIEDA